MKMVYDILYKNGHVDVIEQEITDENVELISKIHDLIQTSMQHNKGGYISLGDGVKEGHTIRLSDISRVKANYIEENVDRG
jgi:hypothetical protein